MEEEREGEREEGVCEDRPMTILFSDMSLFPHHKLFPEKKHNFIYMKTIISTLSHSILCLALLQKDIMELSVRILCPR